MQGVQQLAAECRIVQEVYGCLSYLVIVSIQSDQKKIFLAQYQALSQAVSRSQVAKLQNAESWKTFRTSLSELGLGQHDCARKLSMLNLKTRNPIDESRVTKTVSNWRVSIIAGSELIFEVLRLTKRSSNARCQRLPEQINKLKSVPLDFRESSCAASPLLLAARSNQVTELSCSKLFYCYCLRLFLICSLKENTVPKCSNFPASLAPTLTPCLLSDKGSCGMPMQVSKEQNPKHESLHLFKLSHRIQDNFSQMLALCWETSGFHKCRFQCAETAINTSKDIKLQHHVKSRVQ